MLIAVALAPTLWVGIVLLGIWDLCNTLYPLNVGVMALAR